jgi:hypothetical protein
MMCGNMAQKKTMDRVVDNENIGLMGTQRQTVHMHDTLILLLLFEFERASNRNQH